MFFYIYYDVLFYIHILRWRYILREREVPERATKSLALKPLVAKVEISLSNPSVKLGRFSAKLLLAVVESLLPSLTVHDGPPTCN